MIFKIETHSPEFKAFLVDLVIKYNRKLYTGESEIKARIPLVGYPIFFMDEAAGTFGLAGKGSSLDRRATTIPVENMLNNIILVRNPEVKLNNEYKAIVSHNGDVIVGCQTFPSSVVLELAKKVQEVLDRK